MNIKKFISEEMGDFSWAEEIEPFNLFDCGWIIKTTNEVEWKEVEQYLFDKGWTWGDSDDYDGQQVHADYDGRFHWFYPDDHKDCENEQFDAANENNFYNHHNEILEQFKDSDFINWSDIRRTVMNESNDFDWTEEIPGETLGGLFDDGKLSVGDSVHVMGTTNDSSVGQSIDISAVFVIDFVGETFERTTVKSDDETKMLLGVDEEEDGGSINFSLIDEDRDLMVVSHEKSITESDDFEWAEEVPKWDETLRGNLFVGSKFTHESDGENGHDIMYTITSIDGEEIRFGYSDPGDFYGRDSTDITSFEDLDGEGGKIKFHNETSTYKSVNESSEFDWTEKAKEYPYVGMKFYANEGSIKYTVVDMNDDSITIAWIKPRYGGTEQRTANLSHAEQLIRDKVWVPIINESNDFGWAEDIGLPRLTIDDLVQGYYIRYRATKVLLTAKYHFTQVVGDKLHYTFDGMDGDYSGYFFHEEGFITTVKDGTYVLFNEDGEDMSEFLVMRDIK